MLNSAKISYWERKDFFSDRDLVVIGAGIVGYSTAIHYKRLYPKAKILIIERGILPSGASSKNAGFACFGSPTELYDDLSRFDANTVWETVARRYKGLNYLNEFLGKDAIDLQIQGSWDLIRESETTICEETKKILPDLNEALRKISGETDVYSWDPKVADRFGFKDLSGGFRNRLEGQIDTSKMNAAFYQKVIDEDIRVVFGIEALSIESNSQVCVLETTAGTIRSNKIAICTNGFAQQFLPEDDIFPARAQVLITKPIENLKIKGTFHYQMGYYYFRNIDNRILLGGGRNLDFDGETTTELETSEQIQDKLKELLQTVILSETSYEIDHSWAGVMGVGNTKKPIIKELQPGVYCGVRLGGMGVAIGSLVGKDLANLMK